MMEARDFDYLIGRTIIDKYRSDTGRESVFEHVGRKWDLLDDVWPATYSPGGELFADMIPFATMESFLEMGSGTGIMSVLGALNGCRKVVALDLNPAAVENTAKNAVRHGVADRVEARLSDMYSAVRLGERFDGIYWNPPFLDPPAGSTDSSIWHETMFDPGFAKLRVFLGEGRALLRPGGSVYLWFGEALGKPTLIADLGAEFGYELLVLEELTLTGADDAAGGFGDFGTAEMADVAGLLEADIDQDTHSGEWHLHLLELRPVQPARPPGER